MEIMKNDTLEILMIYHTNNWNDIQEKNTDK